MAATLQGAVVSALPESLSSARVLVACDGHADADPVRRLLADHYTNVGICGEPGQVRLAFEREPPQVLVLAFKSIEASEDCCLGLYRQSGIAHSHPHRTLLLCAKEDIRRAFELCLKGHFDDYVLFWPMVHDATRLAMSVHLAMQALACAQGPTQAQLVAQARQIGELQVLLEGQIALGRAHTEQAQQTSNAAQSQIGKALHNFSQQVLQTGLDNALTVRDPFQVEQAFGRLNAESIQPSLQQAAQALQPMRHWIDQLEVEVAAPLQSVVSGPKRARCLRPVVLVVDDDGFLRKVLGKILGEHYEVQLAASGAEAMAMVRRRSPDLILMDVSLPDIDGVDLTRRLKKTDPYTSIPIIMLTGHGDRQVLIDSRSAGAADFVVKPFNRGLIVKKVADHLFPSGAVVAPRAA